MIACLPLSSPCRLLASDDWKIPGEKRLLEFGFERVNAPNALKTEHVTEILCTSSKATSPFYTSDPRRL